MENGLSLDLGLGDGLRAVKSEEIDKEEQIGAKIIRETQRDKVHKRKEMHDEEYFLKLSLRPVICEQEFCKMIYIFFGLIILLIEKMMKINIYLV